MDFNMIRNTVIYVLYIGVCFCFFSPASSETMEETEIDLITYINSNIDRVKYEVVDGFDEFSGFVYEPANISMAELSFGDSISSPFIISAKLKSNSIKHPVSVFSIMNGNTIQLALRLVPSGGWIDYVLTSDLFPSNEPSFPIEENNQWIHYLAFVKDDSVVLYANCSEIYNDATGALGEKKNIDLEDSTFLLVRSGISDIFQWPISELKIVTGATEETRENLCGIYKLPASEIPDISESTAGRLESHPKFDSKTGDKGEKGEKEEKGESIIGPQGPPGPQGPIGFTGIKGEVGSCACSESVVTSLFKTMPEMRGPKGETGGTGLDGEPGPPGKKGSTGLQGDEGPKGQKGEIGDNGKDGRPGESGPPGAKGEGGVEGPQGAPGRQGLIGPPGPPGRSVEEADTPKEVPIPGQKGEPGVTGPIGAMGLKGEKGDKGDTGFKGEKGVRGVTGDTGAKGEMGHTGEPGVDGTPGARGPHGKAGKKGEPGLNGEMGLPGRPAELSEILDSKADPHTNELIVEKLRGPKGDVGKTGLKGETGNIGPPGKDGIHGTHGKPGHNGEIGPQGPKGEPGEPGPTTIIQNTTTPILVKGPRGEQGIPGKPGSKGLKGQKGATGARGGAGKKGERGVAGPEGQKGIPGVNGIKGEKGESVKLTELGKLKGDKGDMGEKGLSGVDGKPGPPGINGTCEVTPGHIGPPGKPGPPGAPGVPGPPGPPGPIGPPGLPGTNRDTSYLATNSIHNYRHHHQEKVLDDDVYITETIVYRTHRAFVQRTTDLPEGTIAYIRQSQILLVRVGNGWGQLRIERSASDYDFKNPPREAEESPLPTTPPSTTVHKMPPTIHHDSAKEIRLIALNRPYSGKHLNDVRRDDAGWDAAEANCNLQARRYKVRGKYTQFLNSNYLDIQHAPRRGAYSKLPVTNLHGEILFSSWTSLINGSEGLLYEGTKIYSFNNTIVGNSQIWPIKAVWHGNGATDCCKENGAEWTSDSPSHTCTASPLASNKLLQQEIYNCDKQLVVLCVGVHNHLQDGPRYRRRNRSKIIRV